MSTLRDRLEVLRDGLLAQLAADDDVLNPSYLSMLANTIAVLAWLDAEDAARPASTP